MGSTRTLLRGLAWFGGHHIRQQREASTISSVCAPSSPLYENCMPPPSTPILSAEPDIGSVGRGERAYTIGCLRIRVGNFAMFVFHTCTSGVPHRYREQVDYTLEAALQLWTELSSALREVVRSRRRMPDSVAMRRCLNKPRKP